MDPETSSQFEWLTLHDFLVDKKTTEIEKWATRFRIRSIWVAVFSNRVDYGPRFSS